MARLRSRNVIVDLCASNALGNLDLEARPNSVDNLQRLKRKLTSGGENNGLRRLEPDVNSLEHANCECCRFARPRLRLGDCILSRDDGNNRLGLNSRRYLIAIGKNAEQEIRMKVHVVKLFIALQVRCLCYLCSVGAVLHKG
eukprot:XP_001709078.1 Hypothetical protein GL50803_20794 [Giardia lamblia ATCC 50803]